MWGPVDLVQYLIIALIFIQLETVFFRCGQRRKNSAATGPTIWSFLLLNGIIIRWAWRGDRGP